MKNVYQTLITILVTTAIFCHSGSVPAQNGFQNQGISAKTDNSSECNCVDPALFDPEKSSTVDTVTCYNWPYNGEDWNVQSITIRTFDENGHVVDAILKNYDIGNDLFTQVRHYTYDFYETGKLKEETWQNWNPDLNGGSWSNMQKQYYEYDEAGKVTFTHSWFSDFNTTEWEDGVKEFYSYNSFNKKDTVITKYWNYIQNDWYYSYRHRYEYNNNMELVAYYKDWANNLAGDFTQNERLIYVYDPVNNQTEEIDQYYSINEWINAEHRVIAYNEQGLEESVFYQNWDPFNNMWDTLVMNREFFEYNENGQVTENLKQANYIMWVNTERTQNLYYESGESKQTLRQTWSSFYEMWQNDEKCDYPEPENISTGFSNFKSLASSGSNIYPNPARDQISVIPGSNHGTIALITTSGELVLSETYTGHEITVDVSAVPSGIYFMKISSSDKTVTEKIVINK